MTVNVIFQRGSVMAMIGDLMLTSDEARTDVRLTYPPTPEMLPDPAEIKRHYVGLEQKLVTINSHLTIAWAGPLHVAQRAIDKLKVGCATPEQNEANLRVVLQDFAEDPAMADLSITAVYISDRIAHVQNVRALQIQRDPFLLAAGSGWDDIREPFLRMHEVLKFDDSGINDVQRAKLMALCWVGWEIQAQVRNRDAAKKWYGGGYEIAVTETDGVKKLDRVLHLLFGVKSDTNGEIVLEVGFPVIYQFYSGVNLIYRYIYPNSVDEYVILGHDSKQILLEKDITFTPDYTSFVFERSDGCKFHNAHISASEIPVRIITRNGRLKFLVDSPQLRHILSMSGAGSDGPPKVFD
jgi:hypothetical protein